MDCICRSPSIHGDYCVKCWRKEARRHKCCGERTDGFRLPFFQRTSGLIIKGRVYRHFTGMVRVERVLVREDPTKDNSAFAEVPWIDERIGPVPGLFTPSLGLDDVHIEFTNVCGKRGAVERQWAYDFVYACYMSRDCHDWNSGRFRRSRELRQIAINRDGSCIECQSDEDLEVDHIVALCNGGVDHIDNLQTLCRHCHARKTREDMAIYWAARGGQ